MCQLMRAGLYSADAKGRTSARVALDTINRFKSEGFFYVGRPGFLKLDPMKEGGNAGGGESKYVCE